MRIRDATGILEFSGPEPTAATAAATAATAAAVGQKSGENQRPEAIIRGEIGNICPRWAKIL